MTARVPFSIVDEWIVHLDQEPEPWSVHCEVRVPGRLDSDRVAAAALAATERHPLARARMASVRGWGRRYSWEITDRVDHLPLEIVECPDEDAVVDARDRLQSMHVSLDSSPPFALTLAHRPGGDSLIMNLHHAAADGMGSYRLMTSIARAYAGVEDPTPEVNPFAARDVRGRVGARSVKEAIVRLRHLRDRLSEARAEGPPARLAALGGVDSAQGYGFHLERFGREETARLMARRHKPATVNDVLLAGLAIAIRRFNSERGAPTGRVSVMMPVNLRPEAWFDEVVANVLSFVSVSVLEREQSDLAGAQRAVEARTRALKDQRLLGTMIDVLALSATSPVGLWHFLARTVRGPIAERVADTAILSNLGRIALPLDFGPGAGAATELWFSPPGQMPLGVAMGAATMNDEMFLALRYSRRQYDAAGAAALAGTWRAVLLEG